MKKRAYDPIDYECIDHADFWVVEEDGPPEFDANKINEIEHENNIYQENVNPIIGESIDVAG